MVFTVLDEDTGQLMEYRKIRKHPRYATTWTKFYSNDMGRLCQGIVNNTVGTGKHIKGTDILFVIYYRNIPDDRRKETTYTSVVCEVRQQKEYPNHTRIAIGGNHICYPSNVGTQTASPELFKLLVISVLSRKGAQFVCFDINIFYLGTPLDCPEYACIHLKDISEEFIAEYNLTTYARDNWVYFCICKGVYGLP